jgi:hypothetical protein
MGTLRNAPLMNSVIKKMVDCPLRFYLVRTRQIGQASIRALYLVPLWHSDTIFIVKKNKMFTGDT